MQLILSETDLERMPPELRRSLLEFVIGVARAAVGVESETTSLARAQTAALLREVSFHRDGKMLRALLKRLADREETSPATRALLRDALPADSQKNLRRYLTTLNQLTARVTKHRGARLWHYRRSADVYAIHPATRKALHELLPVLARSGTAEEPLWEG